ncbi:MAG: SusC/RagA family TonB-linked outer membrane protein [Draconibacterium sp.]
MKLTVFLMLVSFVGVFASETYSQTTKLSLKVEKISLEEFLIRIEDQSEFRFFYTGNIDIEKKVSGEFKNKNIIEILDDIKEEAGIHYEVMGKQIILSPENMNAKVKSIQQQKSVSGRVIDEKGEPLPGVTVLFKGTTNGTVTNFDGEYTLKDVTEGTILQFSFVGMKMQEIAVTNQRTINITMVEDAIGLDEVVAIGYGVQKKVNMTGAVANISFDEEMENRPITNASQALSGKVPGIWVSQNSGQPGSDGAQIRVRGWGTMNNSNPLVIIDGVEGEFSQVNPNDIESISILKDASSAAIYGSKAANGVILVTTKEGKVSEKMQVNLNSYYGIQSLGRRYDVISNSAEHMEMWNKALINGGSTAVYPDYMIENFRNSTDKYKYPSTNFYDEFFQNSPVQEYNLSIRGGSEKVSSFLSFNYLDQEGITPRSEAKRYGIRANVTSDVNKWFSIGGRFNYIKNNKKNPYTYSELWQSLTTAPPYTAPYTRDGNYGAAQAITNDGIVLFDTRNPFIDAANGRAINESNVLSINVSADIKLSKELIWKTTFATTNEWTMIDKYNSTVYGYTDDGDKVLNFGYNRGGLAVSRSQTTTVDNNFFSTLNYSKRFIDKHDFSAIAGIQGESLTNKSLSASRTNPAKEGLTQVNAGTDGYDNSGNMTGLRMFSYFGRINYAYADKYLLEANLRADASSRFAEGNRWGIFPGFSAGWRMNEEAFIKDLGVFSNLKLRASWGQLGNQNISGYWPYLTVITQSTGLSYTYGDTYSPGAAVTALVDEDITWETTTSFDIGLDLGFLDNRLTFEADYFNKVTSDIIVQLPNPNTMGGLTSPYENVGEMVNKGIELIANYSNQKSGRDQFGYNLSANFSFIDNEVTKFQGGNSPDQLYLIREGYSYRSLYGYKAIGIYQSDEEAAEHMYANGYTPKAGNIKIEDVYQDGKLDYRDYQNLGNTIPKFTYGLTSQFSFKGFDLNILLQGIADVNAFTRGYQTSMTSNVGVISTTWRDAWTLENNDSKVPSLKFDNSWDNSNNSYWVYDISFLKLKNIQLGYSIPESLATRFGLQKIYFYANAQNVFTLVNKDYEGFDPERSTFDNGYDMYPVPRIFSLGINLNF